MAYGYNLYTYLQAFRAAVLKGPMQRSTQGTFIDSEALRYINEAIRHIQRVKKLVPKRSASTTITSGDSDYAIPSDRMSTAIQSVHVLDSSGDPIYLDYLPNGEFERRYKLNDLTDDSGDPRHWTFDQTTYGQILIRPVPTWTASNSLVFKYHPFFADLTRIYLSSVASITATTVYGSTGVTLTGTPATNAILADWEVGFIPTADLEGNTISNAVPMAWHGVASTVTSTTLTLKSAYTTALGAASLNFIASDVSELEKYAPGECSLVPGIWAARCWLLNRGDEGYKLVEKRALELVPGLDQAFGGIAPELAWEAATYPAKGEVSWL